MKRPTINITPAERTGRILVGLVGAIGGLILLGSAGGAVIAILEVLLVLGRAGPDRHRGARPLSALPQVGPHAPISEEASMTVQDRNKTPRSDDTGRLDPESSQPEKKGGHGHWMMIACCIPMLAIAIILVATGVAGAGFILVALACTAMMAMMMMGISRGGGGGGNG